MLTHRVFSLVTFLFIGICLGMQSPRLLLIGTANRPLQAHQKLKALCTHAGFFVDYKHSHDSTLQTSNTWDVALLMPDTVTCDQFFKQSNLTHPNLKYFLEKRPYKVLGFLLPDDISEEALAVLSTYPISGLENFLQRLYSHSQSYDTGLLFKKSSNLPQAQQSTTSTSNTIMLPINSTNPLILCHRTEDSKQLPEFFARAGLLDFYELSEQPRISPLKRSIKEELLKNILQALMELHALFLNPEPQTIANLKLPEEFTEKDELQHFIQERAHHIKNINARYNWIINDGIYAGWMDLDPLMQTSETLDCGINAIVNAHLNLLWLRLNPEQHLSNRADTDKTSQWISNIQEFTKSLKNNCVEKQKQVPGIMINFDITTNYAQCSVLNSAVDFYGQEHTSVPAPLDYEDFWKRELIEPFGTFVTLWHEKIGNGLPLTGVFLDLQMYHALHKDDATLYNNLLDFSDHSWNIYCSHTKDPALLDITEVQSRVYYLTQQNLLDNYFACLQKAAFELGKKIREQLRAQIPDLYIGVYQGAGLPEDWFHLGFLAGLSTSEDPIILASFNTNAYSHMDWLLENNIHCFHIPSMLMSKFQDESDFELINERRKYNDGLWFSRFSHIVKGQPKDTDWWRLEASLLPRELIISKLACYSNT